MSRKISLLFILAGVILASAIAPIGCMSLPSNPYGAVDPHEADPTDSATNNNDFPRASQVALTEESATIDGVLTYGDVDVYSLGTMSVGDQLVFDMDIPDRVLLSATVAVFDQNGRLFYITGEGYPRSGEVVDAKFPAFTPVFEFTVRQTTSPLYIAIASQAESDVNGQDGYAGWTGGPYTIDVSVRRWQAGDPLPQPVRQVVALQFDDSVVDYPPDSYFGQTSDIPPTPFAGLNGRVLDPGWWRPFMTMEVALMNNLNNAQFWTNYLAFATTFGLGGNNILPAQVPQLLYNDLIYAEMTAAANAATFDPTNLQWFANYGFGWAYTFALYLGPGTAQQPGLNIWASILPSTYPMAMDPKYDDFRYVGDLIRAKMQDQYDGVDIEFLIAGVDPIPTNVPVTNVFFVSNADPGLLGLAASLDIGNQDGSDFCLVWAGGAGLQNAMIMAGLTGLPASEVMATPVENAGYVGAIGGHELGHILGLVHTQPDVPDIMSYTDPRMTLASTLNDVPLWTQMFPIGTQDSYLLLLLALGPK